MVHICAGAPAGVGPDQARALLTLYDRYLEASRQVGLRPVVAAYTRQIETLLVGVLDRSSLDGAADLAPSVLAVVDGTVLRGLAEGAEALPAATAAVVRLLRLGRTPR